MFTEAKSTKERSLFWDLEGMLNPSKPNSLFLGSHKGAKRVCLFYSLACSCQNNGINFFDYLSDVLNKAAALPPGTSAETYRNLLPDKRTKN